MAVKNRTPMSGSKDQRIACILVILLSVAVTASEQQDRHVNESSRDYLSAPEVFVKADGVKNGANSTSVVWLQNLFDHFLWTEDSYRGTGHRCSRDLRVYLDALRNGSLWASMMNDASGRYSGQFYLGDEFWFGSKTLCGELQNAPTSSEVPPYKVAYHVARVYMHVHNDNPRLMLIGECLPASCTPEDIAILMSSSPNNTLTKKETSDVYSILLVRPVPGPYSVWMDRKFYIVGGASVLTLILMAIASAYETYLIRKKSSMMSKDVEIQTNNNTSSINSQTYQKTSNKSKYKPTTGLLSRMLLAFSVRSNGRKILATDAPPRDAIACIHGLRFLSLAWIIMVHTYMQMYAVADNKRLRNITERNYLYQTVGNATFSVDTFFFISGLLLTILYYRAYSPKTPTSATKTNGQHTVSTATHQTTTNVPNQTPNIANTSKTIQTHTLRFTVMLLYRVLRLTPAYLFVIGVNEIAMRYSFNNSVFEPGIADHITCDLYWWRNVLYVNNLYPQKEMCMVWSWYMANDTQFYVLGVLMLLFSFRYFKYVVGVLLVFLTTSWITTAYISIWYQYTAKIGAPFEMFDPLYDKPWSRIGPYLVGMCTGWLLHRIGSRLPIPTWAVVLGWTSSLAIMWSLVYGMLHGKLGIAATAAYVSVGHTAWGLALAWITVACHTGHGGIVATVLSYRGALPLSRLTYCAYLVHPMIMMISSFQMDGPFHLHNGIVIIVYMGNAVASYMMSFAISMAFESPVVRLLKIAFSQGKKNNQVK